MKEKEKKRQNTKNERKEGRKVEQIKDTKKKNRIMEGCLKEGKGQRMDNNLLRLKL